MYEGLSTQVPVGINEGLKHDSGIYCDELVSLPKSMLTQFVGMISPDKLRLLDRALLIALQVQAE
jgi:mRNA interferase MazF